MFKLVSKFSPAGDQNEAIDKLVDGLNNHEKNQVLLGATGTGKTFTIANVIEKTGKPTLVLSHNKTLAGQLYAELKEMFPENHVEYFVSYYDYYQPEAYVPSSDTYIEKDSSINDEIDELRHKATSALINYDDVIVVSSVSCIYNIGQKEDYEKNMFVINIGDTFSRNFIINKLVDMTYERNELDFHRGTFRVRGNSIDIVPINEKSEAIRIDLDDDKVESITIFDPLTGSVLKRKQTVIISPASLFVTSKETLEKSVANIKKELNERLKELHENGKLIEEQRLKERTNYDMEMLLETGFCNGIENYSRHLSLKEAGEKNKESRRTVAYLIRLTYLLPALLEKVDDGTVKLMPAVSMSYLSVSTQSYILKNIIGKHKISKQQVEELRKLEKNGSINGNHIESVFKKDKATEQYTFSLDRKYFKEYPELFKDKAKLQKLFADFLKGYSERQAI